MGGDYAPEAVVKGALLAQKEFTSEEKVVLIGDSVRAKEIIESENGNITDFEFIHTTEVIGMDEHPAKAFQKKQNSSIAVGFYLLSQGKIDSFASAGSTGAMLVGAMFTVKSIPGVIRPAISALVPRPSKTHGIMLDVGLNPDAKPEVLYQYGILGSVYAEKVFGIKDPKVALMNLGSEPEKGNALTKATYDLMKDSKDFNFVGNIEGFDMYSGKYDVMVCDGYIGNVLLKSAEGFYYSLIKKRGLSDEFFEEFNHENQGGTPILGINKPVLIGHGMANDVAIKNILLLSKRVVNAKLEEKFKEIFDNDKN